MQGEFASASGTPQRAAPVANGEQTVFHPLAHSVVEVAG
jgi:hypothetical protein